MSRLICPACKTRPYRATEVLCSGCWFTLPSGTRSALKLNDARAADRRAELGQALAGGAQLHTIRIR